MCTFKKGIKNFAENEDVQKGTLRFRGNMTIDVLVPSNSRSHSLLSYGNNPQWLPCSFLLGNTLGF